MATDGIDTTSEPQSWDDYLRENYAAVREQRGWTWPQLSDYLRGLDALELAEWAASQDVSKRAEAKGVEKAVAGAKETR